MKRLLILVSIIGFLMASLLTPLRAQWQLAYNFPEGGGVEDLYFADTSYGWFVGSFTMNSTYYRNLYTSDGGYTFIPQASPTGSYNLYSIFFEDTLTGWSGGGPYNNGPGTVLNTTDGGANWSLVSHPAPKCAWNVITKGGNILLFGGGYSANGGGGILMKTTDGGVSWTFTQYPIASGYGGISTLVAFDESNYVVGGNKGFLARTTDGGVTWIEANLNIDFQVEEISFVNQNLGYAIITDIANWDDYLYITTNGGYTWFEHYSWIGGAKASALSDTQYGYHFCWRVFRWSR